MLCYVIVKLKKNVVVGGGQKSKILPRAPTEPGLALHVIVFTGMHS